MNTSELWDLLGDVEEDDVPHVLTKLFTIYEERENRTPGDEAAKVFFTYLKQAMDQVGDCNLNRR